MSQTSEQELSTSIHIDQFIARPPASVWRALTDPAFLAKWWAPGDIAPVVGHEFILDMGKWGLARCRVLEVQEPERLVYTFTDWTLIWTLSPEGEGTRLHLEHAGFDLEDAASRAAWEGFGPGWRDTVIPNLVSVTENEAS